MAEYGFVVDISLQGSGGPNNWQPNETVPFTILFSNPPAPNTPFDPTPNPPFTPPIIPTTIIVSFGNVLTLTYEYTITGTNGTIEFPATQLSEGLHEVYGDPDPILISFDSDSSITGSIRNDTGGVIGTIVGFFSFIFDAPDPPPAPTPPVIWPGSPMKINLPPPSFKCKC